MLSTVMRTIDQLVPGLTTPCNLGRLDLGPDSGLKVLREPCERFVSIYNHLRGTLPRRDPIFKTSSPEEWGRLLLTNKTLHDSFLYHGKKAASRSHRVTWQQSAYISNTTQIACLPNMTGDVQQILDRFAPGCKLQNQDGNSTPTLKLNTRKHVSPTSADCKVASLLYPGDIYLWHRHCEPPGKSGAGVEMAINGSRLDTASKVQQ